ncbi:MAG: VOC family protein [Deltaproteobacteria bacterium]|nr:VOC family protein [Deltaproteobacteria bacterium]
MKLNPHLSFNGQCEEAFQFYQRCLGGKIVAMLPYGDTPMAEQVPPDWRKKIIHATLDLSEVRLTGADVSDDQGYQRPQGFSVLLSPATAAEADRVFASLSENGTVQMAIQETFWAQRFGMVVDRFGVPWMVSCGNPA